MEQSFDQQPEQQPEQQPLPAVPCAAAPGVVTPAIPAGPVLASIEDFKKLEFRIAQIKEVADHPNADRLYVLKVDVGGTVKQLVAGIKRGYTKEELTGKYIVMINNLQPAMLRGVQSEGMLLAASDDQAIGVLTPDKPVKAGSVVK